MDRSQARLVFDESDARALFDELAARLKAFDSIECVSHHVRSVFEECLAGRGFEFTYADAGAALGASEGVIKVKIGGSLEGVLATLRAMQGDVFLAHGSS